MLTKAAQLQSMSQSHFQNLAQLSARAVSAINMGKIAASKFELEPFVLTKEAAIKLRFAELVQSRNPEFAWQLIKEAGLEAAAPFGSRAIAKVLGRAMPKVTAAPQIAAPVAPFGSRAIAKTLGRNVPTTTAAPAIPKPPPPLKPQKIPGGPLLPKQPSIPTQNTMTQGTTIHKNIPGGPLLPSKPATVHNYVPERPSGPVQIPGGPLLPPKPAPVTPTAPAAPRTLPERAAAQRAEQARQKEFARSPEGRAQRQQQVAAKQEEFRQRRRNRTSTPAEVETAPVTPPVQQTAPVTTTPAPAPTTTAQAPVAAPPATTAGTTPPAPAPTTTPPPQAPVEAPQTPVNTQAQQTAQNKRFPWLRAGLGIGLPVAAFTVPGAVTSIAGTNTGGGAYQYGMGTPTPWA